MRTIISRMKKLFTFFSFILSLQAINSNGQIIFWTENFESGAAASLNVSSYTGPNGAWTQTTSVSGTPDGAQANAWYVTCAESGHIAGACGTGCGTPANATLHIGSTTLGDLGASYDAGGMCGVPIPTPYSYSYTYGACVGTDDRAESPTINCTGKNNILLKFYYIENGDAANDNATVWYSADNGSTWSLLTDPPKTPLGCSPQGQWAMDTVRLPASANNNAQVKIGFRWVNNDDGVGTDPSFAVDSVSLSAPPPPPPPPVATFTTTATSVCQDSCVTVTSSSIGTIDSVRWKATGATIATPTTTTTSICFPVAGSTTIHLYVYGPGGVDSTTHVVTVKATPHPVITVLSGHIIQVPAVYASYQWYNGSTLITGATNNTYTYSLPPGGHFSVVVDSGGCKHSSLNIYSVGVVNVNGANIGFWLSQQGNNSLTLHAEQALDDPITVTMFDVAGRKILDEEWARGSEIKQIDVASVSQGLYILKLNNQTTSLVFKWIKQ